MYCPRGERALDWLERVGRQTTRRPARVCARLPPSRRGRRGRRRTTRVQPPSAQENPPTWGVARARAQQHPLGFFSSRRPLAAVPSKRRWSPPPLAYSRPVSARHVAPSPPTRTARPTADTHTRTYHTYCSSLHNISRPSLLRAHALTFARARLVRRPRGVGKTQWIVSRAVSHSPKATQQQARARGQTRALKLGRARARACCV